MTNFFDSNNDGSVLINSNEEISNLKAKVIALELLVTEMRKENSNRNIEMSKLLSAIGSDLATVKQYSEEIRNTIGKKVTPAISAGTAEQQVKQVLNHSLMTLLAELNKCTDMASLKELRDNNEDWFSGKVGLFGRGYDFKKSFGAIHERLTEDINNIPVESAAPSTNPIPVAKEENTVEYWTKHFSLNANQVVLLKNIVQSIREKKKAGVEINMAMIAKVFEAFELKTADTKSAFNSSFGYFLRNV